MRQFDVGRRADPHRARPRDGRASSRGATASTAWCWTPTSRRWTATRRIDDRREDSPLGRLPIIVYGGNEAPKSLNGWRRLARNTIVRDIRSPERLLDQASLFLHRDFAKLPERHSDGARRRCTTATRCCSGKRVLIVDDDMRNIFALTIAARGPRHGRRVAENGRDAIRYLQAQPDIDVVLMDIMMPEMDGIDTMREIRKLHACKDLPIIAVTAKAMKGDREKCIEAGAWDYLSKPVETGAHDRHAAGMAPSLIGRGAEPDRRDAMTRTSTSTSSRRSGRTSCSSTTGPTSTSSIASILEELGQNLVVARFRRGGAAGGAEDTSSRSSCSTSTCRGWTGSRRRR